MYAKAAFIDKDGTLVTNVPWNADPARIELTPGSAEALRRLSAADYLIIVISNQAGVAQGYFKESALEGVRHRLEDLLAAEGVVLSGFYYCPHHPEAKLFPYRMHCLCRKPAPGLLVRAAWENDINLEQSWLIGDILDDVEAGQRAGCRTILVDGGHETEWQLSPIRMPHFVVGDMAQAGRILAPAPIEGDQVIEQEVL